MNVKNEKISLNGKKISLSDEDELWHSYKLLHIAEVFHKLSKDFEEFQKSDLSKVGNTSEMDSFSDMANALAHMSSYKLKTNQLSNQIHLAEELNKKYKSNHIYDLIELEQDIVSGENDGGKINNRDIFKKFTITKSKLTNQREDFIRILLTLYTSLSIGEKDFNVLSGNLTDEGRAVNQLGRVVITFKTSDTDSFSLTNPPKEEKIFTLLPHLPIKEGFITISFLSLQISNASSLEMGFLSS